MCERMSSIYGRATVFLRLVARKHFHGLGRKSRERGRRRWTVFRSTKTWEGETSFLDLNASQRKIWFECSTCTRRAPHVSACYFDVEFWRRVLPDVWHFAVKQLSRHATKWLRFSLRTPSAAYLRSSKVSPTWSYEKCLAFTSSVFCFDSFYFITIYVLMKEKKNLFQLPKKFALHFKFVFFI